MSGTRRVRTEEKAWFPLPRANPKCPCRKQPAGAFRVTSGHLKTPGCFSRAQRVGLLEARVGIEPTHKGFADLSLTAWVPRHLFAIVPLGWPRFSRASATFHPLRLDPALQVDHFPALPTYLAWTCGVSRPPLPGYLKGSHLERETGLEPATLALARRCSTTELLPHTYSGSISGGMGPVNATGAAGLRNRAEVPPHAAARGR